MNNQIPLFLFFMGMSIGLAIFLDLGLQKAVPNPGKIESIFLRTLVMIIAICTTIQAAQMLGFFG